MSKLHISDDLSLALDFVTQTQAMLAKRGVGKTYTASVEAEELLKAGQQVVVIDPTGAWFGLKSSADGKHAGFPIAVFGGEHADVPLEEGAGEVVAQAIVERRFSAIIDLSFLRKNQRNRFMTAFLETLFRLNRLAMHLFVDEAHTIAPQKPFGEEARMLGAIEDVVMLGRRRGIGCTLICQRPQVLNKNVLTQCEILCCLRLVHPKDIDAVKEWVNVHADPQQAKDMIASLPSLPIGTAWFWAPGWGDIFQRVKIRKRETFDSSATPKAGQIQAVPKVLAPVDIEQLGQQISATVERAKENDPAQLKRRIAELQKQVAAHKPSAAVVEEKIVEVSVITDDDRHFLELFRKGAEQLALAAQGMLHDLKSSMEVISSALQRATSRPPLPARKPVSIQPRPSPIRKEVPRHRLVEGDSELSKGERIVLTAIAQDGSGVDRSQLTVVTGYKRSTRDAYLQRLAGKGFISENGSGLLATAEGVEALGADYEPLPSGDDLRNYWLGKLPEGERKVLEILISCWPESVPRDHVSDQTGYARSSRDAYLQRLASRKLVETAGRAEVKASNLLFDAGVSA